MTDYDPNKDGTPCGPLPVNYVSTEERITDLEIKNNRLKERIEDLEFENKNCIDLLKYLLVFFILYIVAIIFPYIVFPLVCSDANDAPVIISLFIMIVSAMFVVVFIVLAIWCGKNLKSLKKLFDIKY